eukprot:1684318-Heterocapsa_arctica.AAC.1
MGHDPSLVKKSAALHASELEREGLPVHEVETCVTDIDYVGLHFDGNSHEVRLSWSRLWRLRLALKQIESS